MWPLQRGSCLETAGHKEMIKRNVIAFCLFGQSPVFHFGATRNSELIQSVYPGWTMRVYLGADIDFEQRNKLVENGIETVDADMNPMIARFMVAADPGIERFLIRDLDSRLNQRERMAVNEWIASGKSFHVIHDHPYHTPPIGGGMWGGMAGKLNMADLIAQWPGNKSQGTRDEIYNNDQLFLRDMVWPLIKDDCCLHDFCLPHLFPTASPLPAKLGDYRFVGERYGLDDNPDSEGWQQRINFLS